MDAFKQHVINQIQENKWQLRSGHVYVPVFVKEIEEPTKKQWTGSYQWKWNCVQDCVYHVMHKTKDKNPELWHTFTATPHRARKIAAEIRDNWPYSVVSVPQQRLYFSFIDGIYSLKEDKFYGYDAPETQQLLATPGFATCNFFKSSFQDELTRHANWTDIKVPLDTILEYQFNPEECRRMYACLGQLLRPLNPKHPKMLAIIGCMGSGKDSVLRMITDLYPPTAVAIISDTPESKDFHRLTEDTCLYVYRPQNAGDDLNLENELNATALWLNVLHGEAFITHNQETDLSEVKMLSIPGLVLAHVLPKYMRRADHTLNVFKFNNMVRRADPKLLEQCEPMRGQLLRKINRAYLEAYPE